MPKSERMRQGMRPRGGELAGNRTHDPRLKRALLYQLSYELIKGRYFQTTTARICDSRLNAALRHHVAPKDEMGLSCLASLLRDSHHRFA